MNATLTPADLGILATNLDDAIAAGLGDDDIIAYLRKVIIWEEIGPGDPESIAHDFYRATLK